MTEEQYFSERLDDQIQWYSNRSQWNQKWYKRLKKVEFTLSASVPVMVGIINLHWFIKIIIAMAGAAIAIISAVHGLYNFHENWIEYRSTCEALKREKYLYMARCGIYADADNVLCTFIEKVESIMGNENTRWSQVRYCKTSMAQTATSERSS